MGRKIQPAAVHGALFRPHPVLVQPGMQDAWSSIVELGLDCLLPGRNPYSDVFNFIFSSATRECWSPKPMALYHMISSQVVCIHVGFCFRSDGKDHFLSLCSLV